MKIVFSRKGVDGSAGRCASALIDGLPASIPIPTNSPSVTRYGDLAEPLSSLAADLSSQRLADGQPCHLDPDLDPFALAVRPAGWRPALGQCGSALSHLHNQNVGPGDVFLFWGQFRDVLRRDGRWRYSGPRRHVIFGWLAVGEVLSAGSDGSKLLARHPALAGHPHASPGWPDRNAIYLAADELTLAAHRFAGAGTLRRAFELTAPPGDRPSLWRSPRWLDPASGGVGMSYHDCSRWRDGRVQIVARGQEFVADAAGRADAREWLARLLEECG